ncbi:RNA polymerase sigma-70 factor, ECF subfamily [Terribacillus aidingensis]|uniref:RNA polymerase sigma-70 factor, ECF subfamily n=1 Tax=Terribacillus aidingensis TaxID=586416 RepID=A0A285PAF0_9BACI|nr:RNA polymerase sigma factor [Terribacillus aidingensis]SNZ17116.1 RNA polymerase sigma-70 factor, ECF subfamily [Terribacillus aidingensis]
MTSECAYAMESMFQHIYSLYHQRVYHAAHKVLRDSQMAEDAAQETFMKAYRYLDKLEDVSKAGAWLATIASRTAIDMLRKEGKRTFISIELASWELEQHYLEHIVIEEVELRETKQEIEQDIQKLKPKLQEVLMLRYMEDMRESEIAAALSLSKATVKTRLYRAKTAVKQAKLSREQIQYA